jgi:hypothetical protein
MADHLPECWAKHEDDPPAWCICDELRACEQRVRGEEQQRIEAALMSVGQHDAAWELAIRDKALREAREAVLGAVPLFDRFALGRRFRYEALAAIDALKEER